MKSQNIIVLLIAFLLAGVYSSCKKVPNGFLSDIIRYNEYPILVQTGRVKVSTPLMLEGSSQPLTVHLLHVYDAETGELKDELFSRTYPTRIWTGLYDPRVDTTIELIASKQKDTLLQAIKINARSGQLEANEHTVNIPPGSYLFDLEVSNSNGSRIYDKIGRFDIVEAPPYEIPAVRSSVAMKVGEEGTTLSLPAGTIEVERISDEGNQILVEIVDKNGNPFNPLNGEIVRRPLSGNQVGFLQTIQDYSIGYVASTSEMAFTYGAVPFPLNSLGNGFNYYYRIPTQFVHYDEELEIPDNTFSCNARFSLRVFQFGTYKVKVTVLGVTRRT